MKQFNFEIMEMVQKSKKTRVFKSLPCGGPYAVKEPQGALI